MKTIYRIRFISVMSVLIITFVPTSVKASNGIRVSL